MFKGQSAQFSVKQSAIKATNMHANKLVDAAVYYTMPQGSHNMAISLNRIDLPSQIKPQCIRNRHIVLGKHPKIVQ